MIKFIYEQEPYSYSTGSQNYSIKQEIVMNDDASAQDVLEAVMVLLQTATYSVDANTLLDAAVDYAYEHGQEDELKCIPK